MTLKGASTLWTAHEVLLDAPRSCCLRWAGPVELPTPYRVSTAENRSSFELAVKCLHGKVARALRARTLMWAES